MSSVHENPLRFSLDSAFYIEQQRGSKVSGGRVACAFYRLRDVVDYWDVIDVQKHGLLITCGHVHVIFAWHVCVFDVSVMAKMEHKDNVASWHFLALFDCGLGCTGR